MERIIVDGVGRLPAFSHASVVGNLVFVSGTLGTLPGKVQLVEGGIGPETRQTLENMNTILGLIKDIMYPVIKMTMIKRTRFLKNDHPILRKE